MNNKWMKKTLALILTVGFVSTVNLGFAQTCPIVIGEITQAEAESLVFMREEEKMARDVYVAMYEKWQNPVFANIANAEQNHMDAIKRLIDAYGLQDPVQDAGIFSNPELQEIFNQLVEQGAVSELDALKVGALIEEIDILDLAEALAQTNSTYIQQVYQRLLAGSGNHLRAFVRTIEALGEPYAAQYLTQEEVNQILASTNANQGGRGQGRGQGQGQGRGRQGNGTRGNCTGTQNQNFVDANGDGICDLTGTAIQSGQNNRGRNNQGARRGRRGN